MQFVPDSTWSSRDTELKAPVPLYLIELNEWCSHRSPMNLLQNVFCYKMINKILDHW